MKEPPLRSYLEDRIFEIRHTDGMVSRITSYFPLGESEMREIFLAIGTKPEIRSIFADEISDEEWERTRTQIKKRFNDELIGIGQKDRI